MKERERRRKSNKRSIELKRKAAVCFLGLIAIIAGRAALGVADSEVLATQDRRLISKVFTPEVQRWGSDIEKWANDYGLDPNLVGTVVQIESCGWERAVSPAGAQGLLQVMPDHFSLGEDMQDPDTNARRGLEYLDLALKTAGGDVRLALAGYNGGIGVMYSVRSAETKSYVYWGTGIYDDAENGKDHSGRLDEWLNAGGASLCAKAAYDSQLLERLHQ